MTEPQKLGEFLSWKPEYPEPILDKGVLYSGTRALLYGRYKSLKTMLALHFSLSVASGKPWLGLKTPEGWISVLHLQLEVPAPLLQQRVSKMYNGTEPTGRTDTPLWFWTEHFLKLDTNDGYSAVSYYIEQCKAQVLVIDPLYKVIAGDPLKANEVNKVFDNLDKLIDKFGVSIFLVHHSRKGDNEDSWGTDDSLGSVLLSGWPDSVIKVNRDSPSSKELRVSFDVIRHAPEEIAPVDLKYHWESASFEITSPVDRGL